MQMFIKPIQPIESLDFSQDLQQIQSSDDSTFKNVLSQAVNELEENQAIVKENDYSLALGDVDNLAQLQIDSLKTQTLLQTTVQLTTRAVNAYKEIMQMQV